MNHSVVLGVVREGLIVAGSVGMPLLLTALVVGVLISIFQAVTQIQEASLSFVPKILAVAAVGILLSNWLLSTLVSFLIHCLQVPVGG
ncbi:MAG: flagellar biosynthetic protein FliQ [Fimbriimonadaceae bacterium]|nr:flagellar biosynthetic protein FliQ [Fimbriimonadaceae bacterium]QYK57130.1 MAG: flagellar biosynthetic protein FliQ [Fimbriimonadaceae bacterium]